MASNPWSLPKGLTSAERQAVKAVFEALKAQKRTLSPEALNALKFGQVDQFLNFVEWENLGQFGELQNILADMARKAGVEVFSPMGGVNATLAFDLIDQKAVAWAENEGAKLVRQISQELRETIRQTVADSTAGNLTVDQLARRIQTNIPLTPRDARAVDNFRQRNFDNYLAEGMTEARAREQADRKADRYSDKMIRRRARTIARTETAFAAMEGRFIGWESAIGEGLIDNDSKKEWIAEPDACDVCRPLDGMVIPWNREFPSGFKMAPAHPNCRCSVVIMPPDTAESPYTEQAEAEFEEYPKEESDFLELGKDDEALFEFTSSMRDGYKGITAEENAAVSAYTQGSGFHHDVNGFLRGLPGYQTPNGNTQQIIDGMDSIIGKATPLKQPVITYRGMSLPFDQFQVGQTFTDSGFVSTSHSLETALSFTREWTTQPVVFQMQIPKGAKVLDPIAARGAFTGGLPDALPEQELILPRNTKLRILDRVDFFDDSNRKLPMYVVEPIL